jgi:hypothetical protein
MMVLFQVSTSSICLAEFDFSAAGKYGIGHYRMSANKRCGADGNAVFVM